jgi:hypothetical protein
LEIPKNSELLAFTLGFFVALGQPVLLAFFGVGPAPSLLLSL